jgi:hypothetical protein
MLFLLSSQAMLLAFGDACAAAASLSVTACADPAQSFS